MEATRATEQSQDSKRPIKSLNDRYGKIGISAVAAAVCHKGEKRRRPIEVHFDAQESD